ncbi:MAG: hypothetical protein WDM79_18890 [Terricaulis sp.]
MNAARAATQRIERLRKKPESHAEAKTIGTDSSDLIKKDTSRASVS